MNCGPGEPYDGILQEPSGRVTGCISVTWIWNHRSHWSPLSMIYPSKSCKNRASQAQDSNDSEEQNSPSSSPCELTYACHLLESYGDKKPQIEHRLNDDKEQNSPTSSPCELTYRNPFSRIDHPANIDMEKGGDEDGDRSSDGDNRGVMMVETLDTKNAARQHQGSLVSRFSPDKLITRPLLQQIYLSKPPQPWL